MYYISLIRLITFGCFIFICQLSSAQVDYTSNDKVTPYNENFGYGFNPGYNPPWTDEQLADIAAGTDHKNGLNANCIRPTLPERFLEEYGYELRLKTLQHYDDLGLKNNTMFVGYPSDEHRDPTIYCEGSKSEMFANMYEPIWDNGENGTPVNDNNYYALYLYKTVSLYKDYVKFWEIWNEPDFDYTFSKGWLPKGIVNRGNWWDNNPDPCDYAVKAPVFYYVRLLRISWEIIKTIDPDAYVTTGGLGYPSFLDAVMRNTDNPIDGSVTEDFNRKGGAYFDVLSFHSYPHNDGSLKKWKNTKPGFVLSRHSDAASNGVIDKKKEFEEVLFKYGYDGKKYPEKLWILTEVNIPRVQHEEFLGSDYAQKNFIIKSLVECQQNNILQYHVYSLCDAGSHDGVGTDYQAMGMYEKLEGTQPYTQKINLAGVAFKTTAKLLKNKKYDAVQTLKLNLPTTIGGGAFADVLGNYTYVLWAKTTKDMSEIATAQYSFPSLLANNELIIKKWDHAITKKETQLKDNSIALNSTPVFITPSTSIFNFQRTTGSKQSIVEKNIFASSKLNKNKLDKHNLTIKIQGNGSVRVLTSDSKMVNCNADCTNAFRKDSKISMTAVPNPGYTFDGWEGVNCVDALNCTFTLKTSALVTAKFKKINRSRSNSSGDNAVSLNIIGPGTVLIQAPGYQDNICEGECDFNYAHNTNLTFSAIPADDHNFTGWIGTGCYGTANCYRVLDWDMEMTVNFVSGIQIPEELDEVTSIEIPMNITVKGAGKIVINNPDGTKYECRSNCTESVSKHARINMLAVPIHGYYFVGWEGDDNPCKGTGKCFMKVKDTKNIVAVFAPIEHMQPKKNKN